MISRPTVALIEGPLDLPDRLQVEAPVVLVARQGITVRSVAAPPAGSGEPGLVLVSLEGDITVAPPAGSPAELHGTALLAPAGTVRWTAPVTLRGLLCARDLDPAVLARGGALHYDRRFDPTDAAAATRGLALLLGPNLPHLARPE